jgi:hypothetical protein
MQRGAVQTAITQLVRDTALNRTFFCSHGGSCYPTHVYINGEPVEALRLDNCTVGAEVSRYDDEIIYGLEVDRSRNSEADLRFDDVENALIELGLCMACADNAARHYVERPQGQCGTLVKQSLEGNPAARRRLAADEFPAICNWEYPQP